MFNYRSVHCLGLWNLLSEIPFLHQSQSSKSYNTLLVSLHLIMTDHSLSLFLFCVTMCYSNDKQTFALSEVETWELPSGVIKHRAQPHYDKKRWHCARITLEPDGDSTVSRLDGGCMRCRKVDNNTRDGPKWWWEHMLSMKKWIQSSMTVE